MWTLLFWFVTTGVPSYYGAHYNTKAECIAAAEANDAAAQEAMPEKRLNWWCVRGA